jgi:DNA mismatch repair protein MutL
MIHFFVNRRPVESAILRAAVADAYAGLIERGTHPACVLFLDLDAGDFDINVHPAKREIRFRDPGFVQGLLREALAAALRGPGRAEQREQVLPPPETSGESRDKFVLPPPAGSGVLGKSVEIPADGPEEGPPAVENPDVVPGQATWEAPVAPPLPEPQEIAGLFPESVDAGGPGGLAAAEHLGAVLGSYEVFALDDGLLLMERRAAVERILFEWLTTHRGEADASQGLLIPIPLSLAPQEMEEIEPHLAALRDIGIGVEPFGPRTLLLTALPTLVQSEDPGALARLVLGGVRAAAQGKRGPLERRALLAVVSRELAGGGRVLPEFGSGPELLRRLLACEMPYCCPRGRATLSQLSRGDLARRFGLA